ncbi:MAG: hypothetical protein HF977_15225 [ANME-2 cluster archaeon]|nr:hypothetical protein [ANME-2 cluster archaeon]
MYGLTEQIKGGGREWVKSKNCKAKEEDIVYTIGKTSKKGVSPQTPGTHNSTINSHYNHP